MAVARRFEGQTVVILGCATGLGSGMARQFAAEGARLALGDVNEARLGQLAADLKPICKDILSMHVDVADRASVERFAEASRDRYGAIDLVCANAGVADMSGPAWEKTENDWKWVFGVNFFGLVHAVNAFIPAMIERGSGHIAATLSNSALIAPTHVASYCASKKAGLGYFEVLRHDLDAIGSPVVVSAICPGKMISEMPENKRLRPKELAGREPTDDEIRRMKAFLADGGLTPEEAAAKIIDGIVAKQFFILTHPQDADATVAWARSIADGGLAQLDSNKTRFRGLSAAPATD